MEMLTEPLAASDTCVWVNTYHFHDVTLKHLVEVNSVQLFCWRADQNLTEGKSGKNKAFSKNLLAGKTVQTFAVQKGVSQKI